MDITKIIYEHRNGNETRSKELLIQFDHEPSQEEVYDAVRKDTARFQRDGLAGFTIISVNSVSG